MTDTAVNPEHDRESRAWFDAVRRRDVRFDGQVFVGETGSAIYCRPVCARRKQQRARCVFFRHAAAAEKAGLQPCPDCRPELAPGDARALADGSARSQLARLALRRIEDGALNTLALAQLAAEFDVSGEELRNAVAHEFGLTPTELAHTQRMLNARQLLRETDLSVTEIAHAAGFPGPARLGTLFRARYGLAPTALRARLRVRPAIVDPAVLSLRIDYRPPLNWRTLLAFLGARAIPGVETAIDDAYLRTVKIGEHRGWVKVAPDPDAGNRSALRMTMSASLSPVSGTLLTKMKTVFDTRASAADIDEHLARDRLLQTAICAHPGMRLPGAYDGFELLLRAILGQQVSVKGATTLAGRMAAAFGEAIATPSTALCFITPDPGRIADASVDQIAKIGMPGKRAQTIRTVARAAADGALSLAPGSDPEVVRGRLIEVSGIGEWTASYVAMRALAWPDALPLGDLGIKKALGMTRAADIAARTEAWRPWRAYGAIYCWLGLSGG
ncbi:MAG: AlkA N-terminal domain-containing protein [Gammaproteobacteria bacterium]|jgi:AraC family transcriptional regulator of adaptative response / DNA-3-methyladenine glycosylase II